MPIKFAVKIVWLKVYMTIASLITLTFVQGHKLDYFLTCNILDNIWAVAFKLGMTVVLFMALNLTLTLKMFVRLDLVFIFEAILFVSTVGVNSSVSV